MGVLANGCALGHRSDDLLAEVLGVRARETNPVDPLDRVDGPQKLAELGSNVGNEVPPPGVHVLA